MNQRTQVFNVWILGATGRIGRAVAARLAVQGLAVTLVGRGREQLEAVSAGLGKKGEVTIVVADTTTRIAEEIARARPSVVINAIGNYAETAVPIARACMYGGHYVDLAVDLPAMARLLDLHGEAMNAGSTLVTGAGFGVLATEAIVVKLCRDQPVPTHVRVDALASVATEAGVMGEAFAVTTVDVITTGGRRYEGGCLVKTRLGSDPQTITLPDGQIVKSASIPAGELLAAHRASRAQSVSATSALAPTGLVVRALLPVVAVLLSIPALQRFAVGQMARTRLKAAPRPRQHSWGHAVVTWSDGTFREGWLRAGDAMDYTADVLAAIIEAFAEGRGKPGANTPAVAFGPELATAAGGTFIL